VLVEPYLDGELSGLRLQRMQRHLASCGSCRDELAAARSIQEELHALPKLSCPDVVVETVLRQVAASQPESAWSRLRSELLQALGGSLWRPAAAAAGVAAVALLIALLGHQPRHNGYTPQELARAEVEARYAFAIVAQVTTRASDMALARVLGDVVRDVMGNQVIVPITDAVQKPFSKPPEEKENPE
jgi:anti-sigma factor RsiW